MSINYNIYWIDDSPDWVDPVKDAVEEAFASEAINLNIQVVDDGTDIEAQCYANGVDLLVVDYNLPGRNGDELIKSLRESGALTEIVFYSQDNAVVGMFPDWEGVHTCPRDDEAEEKLKFVINRFLGRTRNVAVMRGIIISEAIDVENKLTEIIKKIFGDKEDIFREKILNKAYLDFEKKRMFVKSVLKDKLKELNDATPKNETLIATLNAQSLNLDDLKREIIDQRNILAHSEKSINDKGQLVLAPLNKSAKKIVFDDEWKNLIRANIRKHISSLNDLFEVI